MAMPSFSAESALYRPSQKYRGTARRKLGRDTVAADRTVLTPASQCTCPCCLVETGACVDGVCHQVCCDADGNTSGSWVLAP
jgi:hypothetical protein